MTTILVNKANKYPEASPQHCVAYYNSYLIIFFSLFFFFFTFTRWRLTVMNFWSFRRLLTKPQFISKKMLCYCVCLKCAWSINFVDFFHSSVMYIQFGSKCAKLSCVSENELTPAIGLAAFQIAGTSTLDDR